MFAFAMEVNRRLRWDPANERFDGDAEPNRLLDRPRRMGLRLSSETHDTVHENSEAEARMQALIKDAHIDDPRYPLLKTNKTRKRNKP